MTSVRSRVLPYSHPYFQANMKQVTIQANMKQVTILWYKWDDETYFSLKNISLKIAISTSFRPPAELYFLQCMTAKNPTKVGFDSINFLELDQS